MGKNRMSISQISAGGMACQKEGRPREGRGGWGRKPG